jgi:hypothetical protein
LSALAQDPAADNTSTNQRDCSGDKDFRYQSNSPRIYKSLRLSVAPSSRIIHFATAKNVKIITADGVVTLRGPCRTRRKTKSRSWPNRRLATQKSIINSK